MSDSLHVPTLVCTRTTMVSDIFFFFFCLRFLCQSNNDSHNLCSLFRLHSRSRSALPQNHEQSDLCSASRQEERRGRRKKKCWKDLRKTEILTAIASRKYIHTPISQFQERGSTDSTTVGSESASLRKTLTHSHEKVSRECGESQEL